MDVLDAIACHLPGGVVHMSMDTADTAVSTSALSPGELAYWTSMRAVDKRRREWLLGRTVAKDAVRALIRRNRGVELAPSEIEIVPDPYGRPEVKLPGLADVASCRPVVSIAHSAGTAVALASLESSWLVGVDLESMGARRESFETLAFSPQERELLDAMPLAVREEWALRMWCAKEAVGKALGRGISWGLLAFHITALETATGNIQVELRDGALSQFPWFAGQSLGVYTRCQSGFVFAAMIYQQGAVRMGPSRQDILDYLLQKMGELTQDWDYPDAVRAESLLFTELGFESLDAVVLCTAIQEHYQTPMPFAELLAEIGQQQRDLSINELTDFVYLHLGGSQLNREVRRPQ
jgi:phosphopantetheinyl transferase/acyl carrier protein